MRRLLILALALPLAGCGDDSLVTCDGLEPADGTELSWQLTQLGYGDFNFETMDSSHELITDEAGWKAFVAETSNDGGLSPDFSSGAVWVNRWSDDGCSDYPDYLAWRWDDSIRVREVRDLPEDSCDMALPMIDLLVIDLDDATDLGWCD